MHGRCPFKNRKQLFFYDDTILRKEMNEKHAKLTSTELGDQFAKVSALLASC